MKYIRNMNLEYMEEGYLEEHFQHSPKEGAKENSPGNRPS